MGLFNIPEGRYSQTTYSNIFECNGVKIKFSDPPPNAKRMKAINSLWLLVGDKWQFVTSLWKKPDKLVGDINKKYIYLKQHLDANNLIFEVSYSTFEKGRSKKKQLTLAFS